MVKETFSDEVVS